MGWNVMAGSVLPSSAFAWVDSSGKPTQPFAQFMSAFVAAMQSANFGSLPSATDDAAAAKAGVAVGQLYQNSGAVRIRLT